jgi:[glutamine synthetase] adenylyltransferase / [glutamine synthetase]-adenylyl-L-tyrosine phosphorylase
VVIVKKQYKFSEDFISKLAGFAAGYLSNTDFDKLINIFASGISKKYFTFSSESNLLRIISGMFDKASFLQECIKYPHYAELLISVSVNSNYLTDILVRNPEFFYRIVNPSHLKTKIDEADFLKSANASLSAYKSLQAKVNALRSLKRREILRIGIKDISGLSKLEEVTYELSVLAKSLTKKLFDLCFNEILLKYGIENTTRRYCIIALGKLGGMELNYSSDIDLIIFYDKDTLIRGKYYSEILTEAVKLYTETATQITGAGYIYRVDFRLRPDGRNSPLCRTINEYINYYESRGEDWERQMLIKASYLAGSRDLYNKLMNYLAHFIYPSSFSVSPTEQIRHLKNNIERKIEDENIKLKPGGIRDIEFSVQALQLLNGGKIKSIRTGNTLEAIQKLEQEKLLSGNEADIFYNAYTLFRKIEHYLQLMNDTQTHTIPEGGEMMEKLASYLNFENTTSFKKEISKQREQVRKIFNSITGKKPGRDELTGRIKIEFKNEKKALQDLKYLREGIGLLGHKKADKNSIEAFGKIENQLFGYLKESIRPDDVLQNFVRVIKEAKFPSIWYSAFTDKKFFNSFLYLMEYAQKAVDLFSEDKELREYFLSKKVFEKLTNTSLITLNVRKLQFILAVQYALGMIKNDNVSKFISEFCCSRISEIADKHFDFTDYFIAGLGSLGSRNMTFASDIDLIFVVNEIDSRGKKEKAFRNFLHIIRKELSPFPVDCRLRPEGKSSQLAWEIESYSTYINERARIWEFQAFTRLNLICGEKNLFNIFKRKITGRIKKEERKNLKKEIMGMRKKMYPQTAFPQEKSFNIKKSRGSLADIEFLLQYLMLCNSELYKKLQGKPVTEIIKAIINNRTYKELNILAGNFRFLKNLELHNQVIFNNSTPIIPDDDEKLLIYAKKSGADSVNEFRKNLNLVIKINHQLFNKYLDGNS